MVQKNYLPLPNRFLLYQKKFKSTINQLVIKQMSSLTKIGKRLKSIFLNKYLIVLVVFTVFITFFDEHNLIDRFRTYQKIKSLEKEQLFYKEEIEATKKKKNELESNNENLEKFAREQYLMKKSNEDIFIIKE